MSALAEVLSEFKNSINQKAPHFTVHLQPGLTRTEIAQQIGLDKRKGVTKCNSYRLVKISDVKAAFYKRHIGLQQVTEQ